MTSNEEPAEEEVVIRSPVVDVSNESLDALVASQDPALAASITHILGQIEQGPISEHRVPPDQM